MSAVAVLSGLWVLLGAVWLAVWPLVGGRSGTATERTGLEEREVELDRRIQELHELELDRATGKLSDEDGRTIEARLRARAVEIMQEIDRLRDAPVEGPAGATSGRSSG